MSNINKIKVSGQTYSIQDLNATKTVELTQAEYDALPATAKTSNSLFIITDAQGADLTNYYTKSETSGATEISTALASKQTTLTAGTGISIVDNVISATGGGGGGKAIEAGRGISITTGETADTVSFNLPISAGTGTYSIIEGKSTSAMTYCDHAEGYFTYANGNGNAAHAEGYQTSAMTSSSHAEGRSTKANGNNSHAEGSNTVASGASSHAEGNITRANGIASHSEGDSTSAMTDCSHTEGIGTKATNKSEHASGQYNNSVSASTTFGDSGNTLFSVGNGTNSSNRHNAFEIRQNGDIYIADTNDTSTTNFYEKPMIKLQDALGGGSTYTAGDGIDITNDVISVTGKVDTSAITTSISSSSTDAQVPSAKVVYDQLGGLKLVKLTQSEYDSLATKDNSTLYVIVN